METLTELLTASKQCFVGFSLFWKKMDVSFVWTLLVYLYLI